MRAVWRAFLGALLVVCMAATASAQNGLERFEKDIKPQLELKKFTYADARPLGTSGFILNNVVAVVPASEATNDKETTVKIEKLTVDELDFDRLKKSSKDDASPRFAKLKIEGMTGDDELFSSLEPYGVPRVPVDIALDYRIDPAAKVLTVNTLEINLRGQAKINLALVMDGISDKSDMGSAKDDGRLRTASLTLDDKELLGKLVPAFAKEEGATAAELVGGALDALAGFAQMQTGETLKALDAVSSFLLDWKAPKGPLVLGLKPTKTAGLDDLDKIAVPDALSTIFGFTATYPATRAGAAKAGSKEK
ncbi:MAG: hypothetical protein J0H97_00775 [Alphaproteobacteria bacterium]|jgi:hypothetical protein|nr:hypothetical protein [Alphaproteobacteria bacterium]